MYHVHISGITAHIYKSLALCPRTYFLCGVLYIFYTHTFGVVFHRDMTWCGVVYIHVFVSCGLLQNRVAHTHYFRMYTHLTYERTKNIYTNHISHIHVICHMVIYSPVWWATVYSCIHTNTLTNVTIQKPNRCYSTKVCIWPFSVVYLHLNLTCGVVL